MINTSEKNVIVRWAFLFTDIPNYSSICELFWHSVAVTPFKLFAWACLAIFLSALSVIIWNNLLLTGIIVLFICITIFLGWLCAEGKYAVINTTTYEMISTWFTDFKNKHCTIVKIGE
jgi:hypothetical protein